MNMLTTFRNAMLSAVLLLVVGCSGITPYDPPDYREEPPGSGLFTGADDEFVIYQKADEVDAAAEANKNKGTKQP